MAFTRSLETRFSHIVILKLRQPQSQCGIIDLLTFAHRPIALKTRAQTGFFKELRKADQSGLVFA